MQPKYKKAIVLTLYAAIGVLVQAEIIPEAVGDFLRDHALEAIFVALGLGHVLPEAGKK